MQRKISETKGAKKKINDLGLWEEYKDTKKVFINTPNQKSIDLCKWERKHNIWSFKITKKIRVKFVFDKDKNEFVVYDAGDFHRRQPKN